MMEPDQKIPNDLVLNWDLVHELLMDFIQTEVRRTGLDHAVIGLSGGIDSALVLYLAVDALGPQNVLAVIMPYRTSNPQSKKDALLAIKNTGCRWREVDISPMADPYIEERIPETDRLRRGNIFARLRMTVLYDMSSEEKALVLGTGNKTEILLGYSTLHGDSAWAIDPIGDLYKTQVWELARHTGVPDRIINKAPSADLWSGQTDEGELGISYYEADRLLVELVDKRVTPDRLIARGEDERKVSLLMRKIQSTQFKRTPGPIPKLSTRTVGIDHLYARDWLT